MLRNTLATQHKLKFNFKVNFFEDSRPFPSKEKISFLPVFSNSVFGVLGRLIMAINWFKNNGI